MNIDTSAQRAGDAVAFAGLAPRDKGGHPFALCYRSIFIVEWCAC